MGKVIWTYTIRHSGTHFMFNHLGTMGFTQSCAKFLEKLRGSGLSYFIHEHIDMAHNLNLVADEPIIVTMRNPVEVYRSHMWRGRINTNPEWYERLMLRAFHDLSGIVKYYNAFVLRVDAPDQGDEGVGQSFHGEVILVIGESYLRSKLSIGIPVYGSMMNAYPDREIAPQERFQTTAIHV